MGLVKTSFPVLDGNPVDGQTLGQLALDDMQFKPAFFDVFSERFRGFRGFLSAFPKVRVWVVQSLDLQVTKWQRMAPDPVNQIDTVSVMQRI